ncbi:Sfh1p KNAG_0B05510 [Huiozyma naganishii CBS 8797]|uniref:Chromatin structure-remodeling complex subunit SFH1 n=1 Tax=Huiozyma naganishii (strain ATCC MYA-139 / BCRC 22969 / CBS 8797 / KCTC 17520 / NBRC 10181 / NCYC 3082 / Yp74L-3) TaxID=1071383 RepID=J7S403_HUIN7|nr:hypothetical protein KNAG_0B05510 [Kazachstania naganishii CBS 8797]CCK68984.1 hypothetical protein KNAG_0B05510 [Kazachstania naganishii CBS 8797]
MPGSQEHTFVLLPQAYLSNFHNRVRFEDVALLAASQQARAHKRAKVVNYAEFDTDLFDDLQRAGDFDGEYGDGGDLAGTEDGEGRGEWGRREVVRWMGRMAGEAIGGVGTGGGAAGESADGVGTGAGAGAAGTHQVSRKNKLPDLDSQDDMISILKYPKVRDTFQQSKVVRPYRLNLGQQQQHQQVPAEQPIIVPVSLNLEHNGNQITDQFTWNLNDHTITPEQFATIYARDLDFNSPQGGYGSGSGSGAGGGSGNNNSNSNNSSSSAQFQAQVVQAINEAVQEWGTLASMKITTDLQVIVNLTCNLQNLYYEDNFQWNLNENAEMSPEQFAEIVVQDLGLTREFMPLIACAIHATLLRVKKDWTEGHLNQDTVANEAAFGYLAGVRLDVEELGGNWCPRVEILTGQEIQRREIEKERNLRRLKRESDRMGRRGRRRMEDLDTTLRM